MQKLPGNTMDKIYKSCSIFDKESNKIEFAFFWTFYNFLCILQVSAKHMYYLRNWFSLRSLELPADSRPYPRCTQNTVGRSGGLQLGPWGLGRRGRPEFRRTGGALGRGRCGGGLGGHLGSVYADFEGRGGSGELARQRRPTPAAVLLASVSSRPGQGRGRHRWLQ
jgi:hypothetical protein